MRRAIVSGYFNPLHGGHLDLIEGAHELADKIIVIVNNDKQQMLKKGKIILPEHNRVRLMKALKFVDEVILSIDTGRPVINTMESIAKRYPLDELIFCQGGDVANDEENPEAEVCRKYGIKIVYEVGVNGTGTTKADSSTRINQALGLQK